MQVWQEHHQRKLIPDPVEKVKKVTRTEEKKADSTEKKKAGSTEKKKAESTEENKAEGTEKKKAESTEMTPTIRDVFGLGPKESQFVDLLDSSDASEPDQGSS